MSLSRSQSRPSPPPPDSVVGMARSPRPGGWITTATCASPPRVSTENIFLFLWLPMTLHVSDIVFQFPLRSHGNLEGGVIWGLETVRSKADEDSYEIKWVSRFSFEYQKRKKKNWWMLSWKMHIMTNQSGLWGVTCWLWMLKEADIVIRLPQTHANGTAANSNR